MGKNDIYYYRDKEFYAEEKGNCLVVFELVKPNANFNFLEC